jgi:methionyl-tRNA synthetase
MSEKFFLTTPLYYVNAEPHIGSAYTTIAADAICRFERMKGNDVVMLTGVDEHGGKIEATAQARGISPQVHCDEISSKFTELWDKLNIDYQKFSRTSSDHHAKVVEAFFEAVKQKDDIYQAEYKGLYCLACEDFKNERELVDVNKCPIHLTEVQEYSENNYFFRLSNYSDALKAFYTKNTDLILPKFRQNEVLSWIDEGLKDFPISRRNVKWGIPVPGDPSQTIYVWFDALLGYLSPLISEEIVRSGELKFPEVFNELPHWPASLHLIGKDILRFHAVYWIAMLMSVGSPVPKQLFGHGFLTKDGEKMGKTRGNIIVPQELIDQFGVDSVRFYFLFAVPFGQDGDYSEQVFKETVNAYLANRLGNLFSRVLKLFENYFDGKIPDFKIEENSDIARETLALPELVSGKMKIYEIHEAISPIFALVDKLNLLLNDVKPWNLLKNEDAESREIAGKCLIECLESLRVVSQLLYPFVPGLSAKMMEVFGLKEPQNWEEINKWNVLPCGYSLPKMQPLFSRLI